MSDFGPSPEFLKVIFLGKTLKNKIKEKNTTISEVAEDMGSSQPTISNILNGKKYASDEYIKKIAKAIGLSSEEIKQIFFDADVEEMMYKYPDKEIFSDRKMTKEEIEDFIVRNYGISKEELKIRAKNS